MNEVLFIGTYTFGNVEVCDPTAATLEKLNIPQLEIAAIILEKQREVQTELVRKAYNESLAEPITLSGIKWDCSDRTPSLLDGEVRYQEAIGSSSVTFFDFNDDAHTIDIATAKVIVIGITTGFRDKLIKKQTLFKAIKNATLANVNSVNW